MNSSKTREQLRKKLDSIVGSEQRKQFESIAGQEVPTYQVTCTQAIIPGVSGKARGRQIQYGEFDAVFDVYDLHYQNCILPHERFEISFDQERGEYYPLGSRGLFRQVKASADGAICTNVPCLIQTEGQAFSEVAGEETCRVKLYETEINVWATRPIVEDEIFWVTYQPDRDKPLDLQSGIKASNGRWVPLDIPESDHARIDVGYQKQTGSNTTGDTIFSQRDKEISDKQRIPLFVKDCYPYIRSNMPARGGSAGTAISDVFANQIPPESIDLPGTNISNNNMRLVLRKPGTYSGVIVLQWTATMYGEEKDYILRQQGPNTEFVRVEKSDGSGTELVLVYNESAIRSILLDYFLVDFYLVATELGSDYKTWIDTSSEKIGNYRFGLSWPKVLTNGVSERGEITIPFVFSVNETSFQNGVFTPFELQLWGKDIRGPGEGSPYYSTSSRFTVKRTDPNGTSQKLTSWIKYSPELMSEIQTIFSQQGGVNPAPEG